MAYKINKKCKYIAMLLILISLLNLHIELCEAVVVGSNNKEIWKNIKWTSLSNDYILVASYTAPNGYYITQIELDWSIATNSSPRVVASPVSTTYNFGTSNGLQHKAYVTFNSGANKIDLYDRWTATYGNAGGGAIEKVIVTYGVDVASEQSVIETKNYARQAQQSADLVLDKINSLNNDAKIIKNDVILVKNELSDYKISIESNKQAPIINYIKCKNNATSTIYSFAEIDTSISNATHYKIKGDIWRIYTEDRIRVEGIKKGLNKIEIDFGNFVVQDGIYIGSTSKGILNIFGL